MGRITTAKNKLARREGVDLSLKTYGTKSQARLLKRLNIIPGFKQVRKINTKLSDYGRQLREKQKIKRIYNLSEKKMSSYFDKAVRSKENSAQMLVQFLEMRLDNVIFRLHLAPTRSAARQLITHGHVSVNGKKNSIPSYQVKLNDQITFLKKETFAIPYIQTLVAEKNLTLPSWLELKDQVGKVTALPKNEEYQEPVDLALVIEFYSKL